MTVNDRMNKMRPWIMLIAPFFITAGILVSFFVMEGFAPFGEKSLAISDAQIQYMDYFAYFRDVLTGRNDIGYSFSIGLGQGGIGILTYYLMSPFNLLLLLFQKWEMQSFFDIVIVLKLCVAAVTMSVYLQRRFKDRLHSCITIILSCAYALMQYNIAQARNIMWLDGVYVLPLILLGVYEVVYRGRKGILAVSVGVSVILSWYTAGINCLFSGLWFVFEYILRNPDFMHTWKKNGSVFLQYIISVVAGIMMSCALFFPTVLAMREGRGSSFDWDMISWQFRGNPLDTILNYSLGAISSEHGGVSLYCGSVVLTGCIGLLLAAYMNKQRIYFVMMLILISLYYWQPFFTAFSLLKDATSYWYRYSYISIFGIIFMAGMYYSNGEKSQRESLPAATGVFCAALFFLNRIDGTYDENHIWYTAIAAMLVAAIVSWKPSEDTRRHGYVKYLMLSLVTVLELYFNLSYLGSAYCSNNNIEFMAYEAGEEEQISAVKAREKSPFYRISQLSNRDMYYGNLTANYNEAMGYNYHGIASYTSSPQNRQLEFLKKGASCKM